MTPKKMNRTNFHHLVDACDLLQTQSRSRSVREGTEGAVNPKSETILNLLEMPVRSRVRIRVLLLPQ